MPRLSSSQIVEQDKRTERLIKNTIWTAFVIFGLCASFYILKGASYLFVYFETAREVDEAINTVQRTNAPVSKITWLEDNPESPKELESFVRDQIENDYRLAFEELSYAFLTGDNSGLVTYFMEAALADTTLATASLQRQKFIDWDHRLKLNFYAPDSSMIAVSDTYRYAQASILESDLESVRFAERKLDMVMRLDEGIWRISHWQVSEDKLIEPSAPLFNDLSEQVKAIEGINYIARSAPFNDLWPNLNITEVNADFATMQRLGFNTVRFFLPYPAPEGMEQFGEVLDIAETYDLKVIPTLFDTYTCYCFEDLPRVNAHLNNLYEDLRHPSVLFIDVKNEADRDFEAAGINRTRSFLTYLLKTIRYETQKPTFVGLIDPDPVISEASDMVSLHHYLSVDALPERIAEARQYEKPILLEEFGFHSWGLKLPDPHTEKEQAYYYQEVIRLSEANEMGYLAWTLYDLATGDMPGGRTVERHLGVLASDGQAKDVIRVLQGESVSAPTTLNKIIKFRYAFVLMVVALIGLIVVFYRFKLITMFKEFQLVGLLKQSKLSKSVSASIGTGFTRALNFLKAIPAKIKSKFKR